MEVKAEALLQAGQRAAARRVLQEALPAAREIGPAQAREANLKKIVGSLKAIEEAADQAR
jgi:hypothetical protein